MCLCALRRCALRCRGCLSLSPSSSMAAAYDPAVALVPLTVWKEDLKDRIAVCVQRHTANIVIEDDRRARSAGVLLRRRRPGRRSAARRRPRLSVAPRPLRSPVVELEQHAVGRRAASLCAALLASVTALAYIQCGCGRGDVGTGADS